MLEWLLAVVSLAHTSADLVQTAKVQQARFAQHCDAPTSASDDLVQDGEVQRIFESLLRKARWGMSHAEAAAFIVRDDNGGFRAVEWPAQGELNQARWVGAFPRGAVAIAHTHPNWLAKPSRIDINTARRVGLPVYVVTRTKISETRGDAPVVVIDGDWSAQPRALSM